MTAATTIGSLFPLGFFRLVRFVLKLRNPVPYVLEQGIVLSRLLRLRRLSFSGLSRPAHVSTVRRESNRVERVTVVRDELGSPVEHTKPNGERLFPTTSVEC
jgi:hypothetical protein